MPPAKKTPRGKGKAAPKEAADVFEVVDDAEIAAAKFSPSELVEALWVKGYISAKTHDGSDATWTTPWKECKEWKCLCTLTPSNGGKSCVELDRVYQPKAQWTRDCEVDKAIEQHFENRHFKVVMELQPALQDLAQRSPLMRLKVLGSYVNLKGTLHKVCTPGNRTHTPIPDVLTIPDRVACHSCPT